MKQEDFLKHANQWKNIFLTWFGGTWKSYIINQWMKEQKQLGKKIIVVAPTWVAAINVWWMTINSAFRFYGNFYHKVNRQEIPWDNIDILIIDEISMVSHDLFNYMSKVIRRSRKPITKIPFGWIQVICVWDLAQLPPIVKPLNQEDADRIKKIKEEKWSFNFNTSRAYEEWNFMKIELTEIKRTNDDKLIWLLNEIREWKLESLAKFQLSNYPDDLDENYTHIYFYNKDVDKYNIKKLNMINSPVHTFTWELIWTFDISSSIIPQVLNLKVWARVMVIKNDFDRWLVNGDQWTVTRIYWTDSVSVHIDRHDEEFDFVPEKWINKVYRNWEEIEVWSFTQLPLTLSWAITSHKVQGMTLDKVCFHYTPWISQEAIYVALSRATSYNTLYVKREWKR